MILSLSESITFEPNTLPSLRYLDLTNPFRFIKDLWDWIYVFMVNTRLKIPIAGHNYYFSLFGFIVALFVSGIIFAVFLNTVRASAYSTGSSLRSVDRAIHKAVVKGDKSSKKS